MSGATKVLLETIRVVRHVSSLGLRPIEKATVQAAKAGEELAFWTLKLQPLEDLIGRERTKSILDTYLQAKEVVGESVAGVSNQSLKYAVQSAAQSSTAMIRQAGLQARVIGPLDEHWNTLKVISDLRTVHKDMEASVSGSGTAALRLTPKRFVRFMREAQRNKKRTNAQDPIEAYVEEMLGSGSLSGMGPMLMERKLYTDVAHLILFAFDRALMEANGYNVWGHELRVKVKREVSDNAHQDMVGRAHHTAVGLKQVEALVDRMLRSEDLKAPLLMESVQRQLLINCSMMILQIIEDLTSSRHAKVSLLGHTLRTRLEPLPEAKLIDQEMDLACGFKVNNQAIDQLVDALIEETEVQSVMMPDVIEAELYRFALQRTLCIAQFMLSNIRIRLFGMEVRLGLVADPEPVDAENLAPPENQVIVSPDEVQTLLNRLEDEKRRVERELHSRQDQVESVAEGYSPDPQLLDSIDEFNVEDGHEFQTLAAQDRLSRSLAIHRTISVPIELAFEMVSNFNEYPRWMPFCTSARVLSHDKEEQTMHCEVGFGLATKTMLGTVGDTIRYKVMLLSPKASLAKQSSGEGSEGHILRKARVVADTADGFAYGKRLVYDWRFAETESGKTDVRLDMFFQAKSVFFLPLWDSMQATITGVMMKKFMERAAELKLSKPPVESPDSAAPDQGDASRKS
mmetsp:Transcript_7136/g.15434  ORF Transcript_7136/g.15434 Transcript_7136/m.15434 type:complete len:684 (+) Transcript_7136:90-2141(+)